MNVQAFRGRLAAAAAMKGYEPWLLCNIETPERLDEFASSDSLLECCPTGTCPSRLTMPQSRLWR